MLLMHVTYIETCERVQRQGIADLAIADLGPELAGTDVFRQRQSAGIQQELAVVPVVADDAGQHGKCDVVAAAGPEGPLVQIEEDVDAGPHLGHAVEAPSVDRRGRRAGTHCRAVVASRAQPLGGLDGAGALGLGDGADAIERVGMVGMPGMGQNPRQPDLARRRQGAGDLEQERIVGQDAGPSPPGIDLDQHLERLGRRPGLLGDGAGRLQTVGQDLELCAAPHEGQDLIQLARHDSHRIGDVREAVVEEMRRLAQRRDGDRAFLAAVAGGGDIGRFRRLDVRSQLHPVPVHARTHGAQVVGQDFPFHQQGRCRQVFDPHAFRPHEKGSGNLGFSVPLEKSGLIRQIAD